MPIQKMKGKKEGLQKYRVRVNYTTADKEYKEISRIVYGLEQAKDVEYELEQEVKEKKQLVSQRLILQELFDEYMAYKKTEVRESSWEKTGRILKRYVLSQFADKALSKLSVRDLQQWKIYIGTLGLSIVTRQNIYGEFRAMLNYAVRLEYIPFNPILKIGNFKETLTIKKEMDFYTVEEFKQFIAVAKECAIAYEKKYNSLYEWNYYVFFNIAYFTGCRRGELHSLKWKSLKGDRLSITSSINQKLRKGEDVETAPKNRSSIRTIQIPLPLLEILNEHKERQKVLGLFSEEARILGDGRCIRDSSLYNRNKLYAEMAGVKRIRIHDFRHSHASLLVHHNIPITEISKRLGHSDIQETLNTYSHLYPQEEEKAIQILNAI